jgi:predicted GNAT family acetyltransferase
MTQGEFADDSSDDAVSSADDITVVNVAEQSRYEIRVGGRLAGYAAYQPGAGQIVFTHTKILDEFEGHGVGGRLAAAALNDARAQQLKVVPLCPFIAAYIRRHREYADLL